MIAGWSETTIDQLPPAFRKIVERAEQAKKKREKISVAQSQFLPWFDVGVLPNHLNRSSLFSPVARGKRKFHVKSVLVSRRDCVIEYTGEQLDEADADIAMAMIFFAQPFPLGEAVPLARAALLTGR